jgi:cysteinyl-tRNA synthetase
MPLRLYNTLTGNKEDFIPLHGKKVGMYVCGVTVYDLSHIGHARSAIVFDTLYRYLRFRGNEVTFVRNFTDIDDKIIKRANEEGVDTKAVAERYIAEFNIDMGKLGLEKPSVEPKATEHIPEMIRLISTLVEKGFAYQSGGDVFFSVRKFKDYGKLSKRDLEEMQAGARVEIDEKKENPLDFALWKASKPGEPFWESPWGKGRPGWHIEDTAITTTYFGPTYDIHGGGLDLVFPHHEAEIAQAEAATGVKPLVRFWVHGGLLMIRGERMGHSLGNFVTIEELLQRHDAEALRLYYGMRHYRTPLSFDETNIVQAEEVLDKLRSVYNQFVALMNSRNLVGEQRLADEVGKLSQSAIEEFDEAMDDDFNTPRALATLITYSKNVEPYAARAIGRNSAERIVNTFSYFGSVFGILGSGRGPRSEVIERLLNIILRLREDARKRGDWATSDRLREEVSSAGVGLEDTPAGTRWYLASAERKESR